MANFWFHAPWLHAADALHLFADKTLSVEKLTRRIKAEYGLVSELCDLALAQGARALVIAGATGGASVPAPVAMITNWPPMVEPVAACALFPPRNR